MAGGKKYGVYIAPNAKGALKARAAVRAINRQAGADVAKVVKNRAKADAIVRLTNKDLAGHSAVTYSQSEGRDRIAITRSFVRKSSPGMNRNLVAHEVGHGLGLKHPPARVVEKKPFNLMNPAGTIGINLTKKQSRKIRKTKKTGGYK